MLFLYFRLSRGLLSHAGSIAFVSMSHLEAFANFFRRVFLPQGIRLESFSKCDFIPVDYYDARRVKQSFKKLMRACVPSGPFTDPEKGFLRAVEESEWLKQVQCILQIAGAIVDLLDIQGSSVMICLEDGWDFTTQVPIIIVIIIIIIIVIAL